MKNVQNIGLVLAALVSALVGGYLVHRHDGRLDDIAGFVFLLFALVCMAPAQIDKLREEGSAAWKTFKNPGGAS